MKFKTLFKRILARSKGNMRGMKGCTNIGFLIWKKLCHHLRAFSFVYRTKDFRSGRRHKGYKWDRTRIVKKPRDLRGGKDSPERETTKQILEQVKFVL